MALRSSGLHLLARCPALAHAFAHGAEDDLGQVLTQVAEALFDPVEATVSSVEPTLHSVEPLLRPRPKREQVPMERAYRLGQQPERGCPLVFRSEWTLARSAHLYIAARLFYFCS